MDTSKLDEVADRPHPAWKPQAQTAQPRLVKSRELFAGRTEICIDHEGALYRLKITRQGKLILNK